MSDAFLQCSVVIASFNRMNMGKVTLQLLYAVTSSCLSTCILGQPVAWCITNYETTDVLEFFLHCINTRSPEAE